MKQKSLFMLVALTAFSSIEGAPIFGSPTSSGTYSCDGQPSQTSPTVAGTTVNNGKAITLSGSGSVTGVGEQCIIFSWSGSMSGALEANNSIPVAWGFTVSAVGDLESVFEEFSPFALTGNPFWTFEGTALYYESFFNGSFNESGTGIGRSGSQSSLNESFNWEFAVPTAGVGKLYTSYEIRFAAKAYFGGNGGTLSVDIPAGTSLDFGPLTDTNNNPAVPEPATLMLLPVGMAGILLLRKRPQ